MSKHECETCGREFDSERGKNIHKAQKHKDSAKNEEGSNIKSENKPQTKSLSEFRPTWEQAALGGLIIGLLLGLALGSFLWNDGTSQTEGLNIEETGLATEEMSFSWEGGNIDLEGKAYAGSPDADIVIVSYEDFTCGFCGRHNRNTLPSIVERYINQGEVQYFYKHFPVLGSWNYDGAVAVECAANQDTDAFWEMKYHFYQNQNDINTGNIGLEAEEKASELGLDVDEFNTCYENEETMDVIQSDFVEGQNFDYSPEGGGDFVAGTPSFVIYNRETGEAEALVGAQPFRAFQDAIER